MACSLCCADVAGTRP